MFIPAYTKVSHFIPVYTNVSNFYPCVHESAQNVYTKYAFGTLASDWCPSKNMAIWKAAINGENNSAGRAKG